MVKFREGELVRGWANLVPTTFFPGQGKGLGNKLEAGLATFGSVATFGEVVTFGDLPGATIFLRFFRGSLLSEVDGTILSLFLLSLKV